MKKVIMYVDGACSGNPGPGGWGVYLVCGDHSKDLLGSDQSTTNNKMELKAAIEGLKSLKSKCDVEIYTDSFYVKEGITNWIKKWEVNNWMSGKEPVKNIELWKELLQLSRKHNPTWRWVKGHSGNHGNERADWLACKARDAAK